MSKEEWYVKVGTENECIPMSVEAVDQYDAISRASEFVQRVQDLAMKAGIELIFPYEAFHVVAYVRQGSKDANTIQR